MTSLEGPKVQPSMSQLIALTMSYGLFYKMLQAPVLLIVGLPIVLQVFQLVFDRFTYNHTIISLVIASALTLSVRDMIRKSAPTEARAQNALAKTELLLPCIMFAITAIFSGIILTPLGTRFGIQAWLTWAPAVTLPTIFRGCLCTLLLGLMVISRYVGPPSIMRCSSSPLLAHPFQTALQNLVSNLNVDGLLNLIAAPSSETPGQMIHSPFDYRGRARRFQYPVWSAILSQFLVTTTVASLVGLLLIPSLEWFDHDWSQPPGNMTIMLACIISSLGHLVQSSLNGRVHELNPLLFQSQMSWKVVVRSAMKKTLGNLFIGALIMLPVAGAMFTRDYNMHKQIDLAASKYLWPHAATAFVICTTIFLYLEIFDQTLRRLLCHYPRNMRRVIAEISDDNSNETFLEVAMISVLHSDMRLVESLGLPTKPNFLDMEREELRRNELARKTVATTLLSKSTSEDMGAHLEDDIMRLSLLASLGGGSNVVNYSSAIHTNIELWIQPLNVPSVTSSSREPEVVPLVRALNAYVGGLGEALIICSGQKSSASVNPWLLPSGAICCAIYAVRAVARLILHNLMVSTRTLVDWRSTHLSILIPVFLSSVHWLEEGMVTFTQGGILDNLSSTNRTASIAPELLPIHQEIMECSMAVLEKLTSLEGNRKINFTVTPQCSQWIDSILVAIPNQTYQPLSPRSVVPFKGS